MNRRQKIYVILNNEDFDIQEMMGSTGVSLDDIYNYTRDRLLDEQRARVAEARKGRDAIHLQLQLVELIGPGSGYLYVVQLVPELSPNRIKLGHTRNLRIRMASYLTACPTAVMIAAWDCSIEDEKEAIRTMTWESCRPLSDEVFDTDDLELVLAKGRKLFGSLRAVDPKE